MLASSFILGNFMPPCQVSTWKSASLVQSLSIVTCKQKQTNLKRAQKFCNRGVVVALWEPCRPDDMVLRADLAYRPGIEYPSYMVMCSSAVKDPSRTTGCTGFGAL